MRLCWAGFDRWLLCGLANMHVHVGPLWVILIPGSGSRLQLCCRPQGRGFDSVWCVCLCVHVHARHSNRDMEHLLLSQSRVHRRCPATELEPST